MNDVAEAIEAAAGADDEALSKLAVPSARRVVTARNIVRRFLQNVPDHMTAMELRREVEDLI